MLPGIAARGVFVSVTRCMFEVGVDGFHMAPRWKAYLCRTARDEKSDAMVFGFMGYRLKLYLPALTAALGIVFLAAGLALLPIGRAVAADQLDALTEQAIFVTRAC